jgi:3-deoxy-7-phosphoheptulonate synthase
MPVGFKNGTAGTVGVAIDAIRSASYPHWFPSLTKEGMPAILQSTGNPHCYLILRGGSDTGPNYERDHIKQAKSALTQFNLPPSIIVDCSHGNSRKNPANQAQVIDSLCEQITGGETAIRGLMLESHLVGGNQQVIGGNAPVYGQSITDACLPLEETLSLLHRLADTVRSQPG